METNVRPHDTKLRHLQRKVTDRAFGVDAAEPEKLQNQLPHMFFIEERVAEEQTRDGIALSQPRRREVLLDLPFEGVRPIDNRCDIAPCRMHRGRDRASRCTADADDLEATFIDRHVTSLGSRHEFDDPSATTLICQTDLQFPLPTAGFGRLSPDIRESVRQATLFLTSQTLLPAISSSAAMRSLQISWTIAPSASTRSPSQASSSSVMR
ncbi:hypothetical protein SAMN05428974_0592 [Sphingopyxis sp. YR583]|nr:hypothetical protein SAMN05428974_0592 [Sphingopyxis sp. YR583]